MFVSFNLLSLHEKHTLYFMLNYCMFMLKAIIAPMIRDTVRQVLISSFLLMRSASAAAFIALAELLPAMSFSSFRNLSSRMA